MRKIRIGLSLLLALTMIFVQIPMVFAEDLLEGTDNPLPEEPSLVTGPMRPLIEGWAYNYNSEDDYSLFLGYKNDRMFEGNNIPVSEGNGIVDSYVAAGASRYEPLLPTEFGLGRSEYFPNAYWTIENWDGSYFEWRVSYMDLINGQYKLTHKQQSVGLPGHTGTWSTGDYGHNKTNWATFNFDQEVITLEQGETIQLGYSIGTRYGDEVNLPTNPDPEFTYELDRGIQSTQTSQEQMPIVEDLGGFTFKAYDVGQVEVSAWITNNAPPNWNGAWPVEASMDTLIINVVPKSPIDYEYGSFGLAPSATVPQTRIGLEGDYEKLAVLAQVVEPAMLYIDELNTSGVASAVVGNLRNDILSRDNGRRDIQDHEYHLLEDEFYTLFETSKGPAAIKPFNYFAADAGLLLNSQGEVIGITDTTIIDYEDNETNNLVPQGVNSNPTPEIHRIPFNTTFNEPPVVLAQLSSHVGPDYSHIRIVDVTTTYFDVFIEEWDKHRASDHHAHEYMSYLAVAPGVHQLATGDTLEAGFNPSGQVIPASLQSGGMIYFDTIFDELPILFSQTQTRNDSQQVWVGQHPFGVAVPEVAPIASTDTEAGPTTEDDILGFAYELLTEQPPHGQETVGYVAIGQPYTPYPVSVALTPKTANAFNVPYELDPAVTQQYEATVYDQHDRPMDLEPAIEASDLEALDFDFEDGLLTIDQNTLGGTFTITATYGDLAPDTLEVTITREEPVASRMTLTGPESLSVPYVNLPAVVGNYIATVYDQYGWVKADEATNVTLGSNTKPSVSVFDSTNNQGTLTIDQDTMGGAFVIVATHEVLGDVRLNGTVVRETPKVYNLIVRVDRIEMLEQMAYDAEIDVPYYNDGPNVGYFQTSATDQYGYPILVSTSLEGANVPDDVDLVGMNIEVSYDDDAGVMTAWAVLNGITYTADEPAQEDQWHFTVAQEDRKSNNLTINIKKDPSVATYIEWTEYTQEIDVPYEGDSDTYLYSATVYDQYMDPMAVTASIDLYESDLPANVTLINGNLAVIPSSEAGTFELVATYGELSTEPVEVEIYKEEPYPTRVAINGATDINIPLIGGTPVSENYTATVYDQYGAPMSDIPTYIEASFVTGTDFTGNTLTVSDLAPHYYVFLYASIDYEALYPEIDTLYMDYESYENDENYLYVMLHKTVEATHDDVNNIILNPGPGMEYWYDGMLVPMGEEEDAYWRAFEEGYTPKFPGNIDVYVRYGTQRYIERPQLSAQMRFDTPENYGPGQAKKFTFTVIPPVISGNATFINGTNVSITQIEEPNATEGWYQHQTWYRLNGGDWNLYELPFTLTQTTLVEAKTVTTIGYLFNRDFDMPPSEMPMAVHESLIVSRTFTQITPEPEDETTTIEETTTPLGGDLIIEDLETPLGAVTFNAAYMTGYEDGTFRPTNQITRAELATIFARILALNLDDKTSMFTDVKGTEWYTPYINAAYAANVVMPNSAQVYGAKDGITRAEFATIINQYWTFLAIDVKPITSGFADTAGLSSEPAILKAVAQGVMSGYDNGMFKPNDYVSRQEVAQMVNILIARAPQNPLVPRYSDVQPNTMYYGHIEAASANLVLGE